MINNNKDISNITNYSNNEDIKEFLLIKNNSKYYFLVIKQINNIIIKCKNYYIDLNLDNIFQIFQINYDSIEKSFIYIINLFIEEKIMIMEIIDNEMIKLSIKNTTNICFNLIYSAEPNNLTYFFNITKDSFSSSPMENTFSIFKSFNNIVYLIYATKDKTIKCLNLFKNKIIAEIKNAHYKFITNFKHYYDYNRKADIIMSISSDDNEIKLWNVNNWECILTLNKINKGGNLLSACFLEENKNFLIVTSNFEIFSDPDSIKIYNDKGNIIKEIINSRDNTFFIEVFFDKIKSINYIITCNINFVKSYDYSKNIIYHKYYECNNSYHNSFVINCYNNIVNLIELCNDGNIRIWDFHLNILLNKIKVDNNGLTSACIWNDNYILVGCKNKGFKLLELNEKKIKKLLKTKNNIIYAIEIIDHPKYGKSLITQGTFFEQIKFWIN